MIINHDYLNGKSSFFVLNKFILIIMKLNLFRKEAHREFRRLYHLEEKRRQQLLNRHEFEIDEQRQEFRRKREELIKKYDFELQTMEQKQKIEIERESVLLTNEYNKKTKQIRMGLFFREFYFQIFYFI